MPRPKVEKTRGADSPKVEVRTRKGYGKAVYAIKPVRKNETVAVFDGEFYPYSSWDPMPDSEYKYVFSHVIQCGPRMWRGAKGIADKFNHSCEPNCGIRGLYEVVAMRDIKVGEELTWDYAMTEDYEWSMRCRCGAPGCRKVINRFKNLPEDRRRKYKGYISDWLVKKYRLGGRPASS